MFVVWYADEINQRKYVFVFFLFFYSVFSSFDLIDPLRDNDCRELCRCGMTNFGAGCGVHCGCGIELVDCCRGNVGRIMVVVLDTWIDAERIGPEILLRGGIAGGGPRDVVPLDVVLLLLVTEFCDWTRGGTCGNLPFDWSVDDWRETMLGARCSMADVTLVIDCVIDGCTGDTFVVGTCGFMVIVWVFGWVLLPFGFVTFVDCWFVAEMNIEGTISSEIDFIEVFREVFINSLGWATEAAAGDGDIGDFFWSSILYAWNFFFCSWPAATYENTQSTE